MKLNNRNITLISLAVILLFLLICYLQFVRGFNARSKIYYNDNVNPDYIDYLADEFEFKFDEEKHNIVEAINFRNKYWVILSIRSNENNFKDISEDIIELCKITDKEASLKLTSDDFERQITSIKQRNETEDVQNLNDYISSNNYIYIENTEHEVYNREIPMLGFLNGTYYVIFKKDYIRVKDENKFKQILKGGRYYN
ncbi:hypothetical protein FACS189499_05180 [Clostridia bacterium]|nr:hypothetical protein FACS189499_05180 [Clostridia bacterium]